MSFALSVTQPAPACTEHELVAAVRQGNDQAFEELYARYRPRIASYIFGMVGDHARAEDLVQEVFISALRRMRETDQTLAFKPWIYEIAKNSCIDEFRRTRRVREVPLAAECDLDDDGGEGATVHSHATTDGEVETKQSLESLRGAFYGLSETHHKIIVMRELAGLSYAEIGERLGMSQAMVESNLFRARRRLSEEYSELVSGRRCESVQTIIGVDDPALLRKLGVRQRRQVARHLAHCQPCRREARTAGLDESFFKPPTLIGKIAALLPFPWLRWHRSGGDEDAAATGSSHGFSAFNTLQNAARWFDPSAPSTGLGRAATALAALAVAAVGGGVATTVAGHPSRSAPPRISTAAANVRSSASIASTHKGAAQRASSTRSASPSRAGASGGTHHSSKSGGTGSGGSGGATKSGKGGGSTSGGHHGGGSGASSSGGTSHNSSSGSSTGSGSSGSSGSTSHSTSSSQSGPQLPVVSQPHSVTVGGVTVTTPTVTVPKVALPKVPLPKVQVPKVQVPTVSVPSPTKVVKKILGG